MKTEISFSALRSKILDGKIELQSDLYGSSTTFADIRKVKSGKRHTYEVTGRPTIEEATFFNL